MSYIYANIHTTKSQKVKNTKTLLKKVNTKTLLKKVNTKDDYLTIQFIKDIYGIKKETGNINYFNCNCVHFKNTP